MKVTEMIQREREHQINDIGYTSKHDDWHKNGELASAAVYFAAPPQYGEMYAFWRFENQAPDRTRKTRIEQLVIAGALIVAEIERLQRAGET